MTFLDWIGEKKKKDDDILSKKEDEEVNWVKANPKGFEGKCGNFFFSVSWEDVALVDEETRDM